MSRKQTDNARTKKEKQTDNAMTKKKNKLTMPRQKRKRRKGEKTNITHNIGKTKD